MIERNIFICIHLWILILSTTCTFVFLVFALLNFGDKNKRSCIACCVSFIICITSIIFYFVGIVKCNKSNWTISETPYSVERIIALKDSNLISGSFYLKCGYIKENLYYQYIVQLSNGGFVVNKINSSNATLYYDTENYRVERYTKTKKWLYWEMRKRYNRIYIPKGSIINDYYINLN